MENILVVYFSLDGNTRDMANRLANEFNCKAEEITLVKPMPKSTFARMLVGGGQVTVNKLPMIEPLTVDPNEYDLIVIGTPVWAGKCSSPVRSLIESIKEKERIRAAYTFSAGGDNVKCEAQLRRLLPDIECVAGFGDRRGKYAVENETRYNEFAAALRKLID